MDKRLQEIQHGTLTESRLNSDFLYWLKTKGPNWLLGAMMVFCAIMGWNWWENRAAQSRDSAWNELLTAQTPQALIEVANKHGGTDAISELATLNAADAYMESLRSNKRFDREAGAADAAVTPELRTEYLAEADRLYAKVAGDGKATGPRGLLQVAGLFGRAAVAETRGDAAQAEQFLTQANQMTQKSYPHIAAIALEHQRSLPELSRTRSIPSRPAPAPAAGGSTAASTVDLLAPSATAPASVPAAPTTDPAAPASTPPAAPQ
jgi:hypothetical protein